MELAQREVRHLPRRHLAPNLAIKGSTAGLRRATAPLLEEERHASRYALVTDRAHPLTAGRACVGAALASYYHPADVDEVEFKWAEKRF